jgi:hypothetical protein
VAEYHAEYSPSPRFAPGTEGTWPKLKGLGGKLIDLSRFPDPKRRSADMFYLKKLKGNWYGLTNTRSKAGFGMAWDAKTFPYLWFWQVFGGDLLSPFWGRGYLCAIEPFSSIPTGLANAAKRGTQIVFKPGQTKRSWLTAVAYHGLSRVKKISKDGKVS